MNKEQAEEANRRLDEAVNRERIILNLDTIQARMLLAVHRVGTVTMTKIVEDKLDGADEKLFMEAVMFAGCAQAYPREAEGLKQAMINFDKTVGEQIKSLCHGVVHDQLTEMLGEDIARALTGKKRMRE